jgi:hypothetical protein
MSSELSDHPRRIILTAFLASTIPATLLLAQPSTSQIDHHVQTHSNYRNHPTAVASGPVNRGSDNPIGGYFYGANETTYADSVSIGSTGYVAPLESSPGGIIYYAGDDMESPPVPIRIFRNHNLLRSILWNSNSPDAPTLCEDGISFFVHDIQSNTSPACLTLFGEDGTRWTTSIVPDPNLPDLRFSALADSSFDLNPDPTGRDTITSFFWSPKDQNTVYYDTVLTPVTNAFGADAVSILGGNPTSPDTQAVRINSVWPKLRTQNISPTALVYQSPAQFTATVTNKKLFGSDNLELIVDVADSSPPGSPVIWADSFSMSIPDRPSSNQSVTFDTSFIHTFDPGPYEFTCTVSADGAPQPETLVRYIRVGSPGVQERWNQTNPGLGGSQRTETPRGVLACLHIEEHAGEPFELYGVNGEKVYEGRVENDGVIQCGRDVTGVTPGVYFVRISGRSLERTYKLAVPRE